MAQSFNIQVKPRDMLGTAESRRFRHRGFIPAVAYGHGQPATSLLLDEEAANSAAHHGGIVDLALEGQDDTLMAIVKQVQYNRITGKVLHIDFQQVRADEEVHATVPVEPHGEPAGAAHGGQLQQPMHMLEISCLPADLPEMIVIDVSGMEVDETMHVNELVLPEGVQARAQGELPVFQVRVPRVETEEAVGEEAEEAEGAEAEGEAEAEEENEG